ncbi:phosphoglycerate mutase-like protein [Fomitopsis serialis]|uniref:phosphoglycerate mutase-like protein n=1 Tax=Fomitopsis serialis TaxID=139415 RepID=UPI0020077BA7|nr:phosphoglycerate mutase-like protein [Neoantrodia serialis]KAH9929330.1 phosphoglycerate mutase-like protein [Neoantrodia serialis]
MSVLAAFHALHSSTMKWAQTRWLGFILQFPAQMALALLTEVPIYNGICSTAGVYNTSFTPADLPWNTYNYCNAPHVNAAHYEVPGNAPDATLVYLNAMVRHHKRTPDNLYPEEGELNQEPWDCSSFLQFNHGGGTTHIFHETYSPPWHPFLVQIWNGTCDEGQLTYEGLQDAIHHGEDFWSVYAQKLGFLQSVNEDDIFIRTSVADRTYQVAGGLLTGMDPTMATKTFPVLTQPSAIDSIVPDYSCPNANSIRNAYQSVPAWNDHLEESAGLQDRLCTMLGVTGNTAWTSWYDHFFDTFSSRTCHGHALPCNASGACATVEDVARVFAIGDWEYNYIWNAAENATAYSQLTFGVFFMELAHNFKMFRSGGETHKLRFYVGHDGSMIRLASLLGLGKVAPLRWPAMGSEIIMEVWKTTAGEQYVRIMHEGTAVPGLEWLALDDFIDMLEAQVPPNVFVACMGS